MRLRCFGLCFEGTIASSLDSTIEDWDYLGFVQTWPVSECLEWLTNTNVKCSRLVKLRFWTIRGLWPTSIGTRSPAYCQDYWPLNKNQIRPIEPEIKQRFNSIRSNLSQSKFWSHEWAKHGTCAVSIEPLNTQLKYFSQAVSLNKEFSLTDIFISAGIRPSDEREYCIEDVQDALLENLGVFPLIQCYKAKGRDFLMQVMICLNENLQAIDCENALTNCNDMVTYPSTVMGNKFKFQVDFLKLVRVTKSMVASIIKDIHIL